MRRRAYLIPSAAVALVLALPSPLPRWQRRAFARLRFRLRELVPVSWELRRRVLPSHMVPRA